ncbi:MAG: hypothetical protein ACRBB6_04300 [Neptuniibacter sp.]
MSAGEDLYVRENALMEVQPIRTQELIPRNIRFGNYPDGSLRLQGAYFWTEGFKSGVTWEDIPVVQVDENGQEIN